MFARDYKIKVAADNKDCVFCENEVLLADACGVTKHKEEDDDD